jgi:hypothetical protein
MTMRASYVTRIAIGVTALGVGLLVYLADRRPEQIYFLQRIGVTHALYGGASTLFGSLGQNLPAFIHAFAFALITGGILACGQRGSLIVVLGWFATDAAFELGQRFPAWSEQFVPRWFDSLPVLESARPFFRDGTFDPLDLFAMAVGAVAAYFLLLATMRGGRSC